MNKVIIIGDSTHNTLGAVRSFGEAKIPQILLLVCHEDTCCVRYSRYLKEGNIYMVQELDECAPVLNQLKTEKDQFLITTYDAAAEWVDGREPELSLWFRTPCRGRQLGHLFNKYKQCLLAKECGLIVPEFVTYHRASRLNIENLRFPLITKPLVSSAGDKKDIHICQNIDELNKALLDDSHCDSFLLQEFIEKEYEIDAIGVSVEDGIVMGGAIHKIRHWPRLVGAGAFGVFEKISPYGIDVSAVNRFLELSGYHGPFSVEFLHTKDGTNYFLEVNFRNDGLAYASTCAGANLHALYVDCFKTRIKSTPRRLYMMNYSIDLLYVKEGDITRWQWLMDFLKTRCFINICFSDLGPSLAYYKEKFFK